MPMQKTGKKSRTKPRRGDRVGLALAAFALAAVLLYIAGGVRSYGGTRGAEADIAANRAALAQLEAREPADLNAELK